MFGRDRRPRHRRAIRAGPSPLGAERGKNSDQASRWACDSLLSRLAYFSMAWLGFHCASMLRLTTQPDRSNHLHVAPFEAPCGICASAGVPCVLDIVARHPVVSARHIEPESVLVPGPF